MKVSTRTKDLYQTIKRFSKEATLIVHAGDPDREGQLLVDEVLEQIGVDVPVKRLLISDLNPAAIKKALSKLAKDTVYAGLRDAALGRSRADWRTGGLADWLYGCMAVWSEFDPPVHGFGPGRGL